MSFSFPPFEPHPWLRNAHAMTIASALWRRQFVLPNTEQRKFQVEPHSSLLAECNWQQGRPRNVPVLVVVHGLEGSSQSNYMRGIAEKALQRGFHVIRLNQRNCGGSELLTPTLYNSAMSADYRAVLEELATRDGFRSIFFAGYSMGGNLVTKMAGEYGDSAPAALHGVCGVGPSLDLTACADALEWRQNFVYQEYFVRGLTRRYAHKVKLFPDQYSPNGFGPIRSVRQFDDVITAPCFGYRDATEYYEAAGAKNVVDKIRVPFLLIAAKDDPFIPFGSLEKAGIRQNPAITLVAPDHGGHCSFISRHNGPERFWAEQRIVDFCASLM